MNHRRFSRAFFLLTAVAVLPGPRRNFPGLVRLADPYPALEK